MAKITDNSDELTFHQLTSQSASLIIPLFQRPYVWSQKQLRRMTNEIESIVDEKDQSRFLGAIIAVTRPVNPSQPTPYEVVDGQQRLTTLYLFLLAAAQIAAREGKSEYARGLIGTNLIVEWAQEAETNTKLRPSMVDRNQFRAVFKIVENTGDLSDWLPTKARLPHGSGPIDGALVRQFKNIQKYLRQKFTVGGFEAIEALVDAARNGLTFVFILLKDPGSATTVFEGLNDPGVPIAIGDLVKNEVFSRQRYDDDNAQVLHDNKWVPFRDRFGDKFDDYFFPYSVIMRTNTSRTEMFSELREVWKNLDASEIIQRLEEYVIPFLALNGVADAIGSYPKPVAQQIKRMVRLKQPAATYPFEMRLLKALDEKNIATADVVGCLKTIESFLTRRAICGIEPTGLLGMFRVMWSTTNEHPTAQSVASVILKRLTVEWPTDQRLSDAIRTRPLYGSTIARYVMLEYDQGLGGDHPEDLEVTIEHIMPRSLSDEWSLVVDKTRHGKIKDLWGNLTLSTEAMNQTVAQSEFAKKRKVFAKDSMYVSTRKLGSDYQEWSEDQISERSMLLYEWAAKRWKRPTPDA